MNKLTPIFLIFFLFITSWAFPNGKRALQEDDTINDDIITVEGLPFCALIYFVDEDNKGYYDIRLLMSKEYVTEDNLHLLSQKLSEKFPPPKPLYAYVDTNAKKALTAFQGVSHGEDERNKGVKPQLAVY